MKKVFFFFVCFFNVCKFIQNKILRNHMYISIHSLCSILCWCTFGSNYSLKSFWIWCHKLGTPIFGQFCPFLFAAPLKLHQVGWEALVHSHFQIAPEMFNRIQVWALAGPLMDIHRFVLKPLLWYLGYLGCVLMVVVLLNNEPSLQSEVKSALEQVFIQDVRMFIHCCIHLSRYPD